MDAQTCVDIYVVSPARGVVSRVQTYTGRCDTHLHNGHIISRLASTSSSSSASLVEHLSLSLLIMTSLGLPGLTFPLPSSFSSTISTAFGSGLIGLCLTAFLCGIAVLQAYHCLNEYPEDKAWLKTIIWLVTHTILIQMHLSIVCAACYHYIVGVLVSTSIIMISDFNVKWFATVAMHLVIAAIVLLYFTQTCYRILADKTKIQKLVLAILAAPILTYLDVVVRVYVADWISLSSHETLTAEVFRSKIKTLLQASQLQNAPTIPMVAMQVAADILVSIALCIALPKPAYRQTRGVIRRIIIYTVSRGIITSIIVLAPHSLWFAAAEFIIPGLYANSLFSALNSRNDLRKRLEGSYNSSDCSKIPPARISVLEFHRSVPSHGSDHDGPSLDEIVSTKEGQGDV
ncbi:hypothetical protein BDY19DRAFT_921261 [Irpex rosettiformis]|uniref:Uncharacterized protein n=1 Tax=Irpex rosettiformis TaxID=378272 RepID=A0ACB8UF37_9APHY|nr:hypothetical protein BDY19DRAFT_921261 [Irpex rosettiformis]